MMKRSAAIFNPYATRLILLLMGITISWNSPQARALTVRPTEWLRYTLHYEERGEARLMGNLSGSLQADGMLHVVPIPTVPGAIRLWVDQGRVQVQGGMEEGVFARALSAGCVVYTRGGMVQSVAFPPETRAGGRNLWKTLTGHFLSFPARRAVSAFTQAQADINGTGLLKYTPRGAGEVERLLIGYRPAPRVFGPKTMLTPVIRGSGRVLITLQRNRLVNINGFLRVNTILLPNTTAGSGEARFSLRRLSIAPITSANARHFAAAARNFIRTDPAHRDKDVEARRASWKTALQGITLEQIFARVTALDSANEPFTGEPAQSAFRLLTALLSLDAQQSAFYGHYLATNVNVSRPSTELILAALSSVAASENTGRQAAQAAQTALLRALAAARTEEGAGHIAMLLADAQMPTYATIQALIGLATQAAPKSREAGRLALGSAARNLYQMGQKEQARRAIAPLLHLLADSNRASERRVLLLALGNAGLPEAQTPLEQAYKNDPENRATACFALRFLPVSGVTGWLLSRLNHADARVRSEAARGLLMRPLTPGQLVSLSHALTRERTQEVRTLLLENIAAEQLYQPQLAARILTRCH